MFKREIGWITDDGVRDVAEGVVEKIPEYFYELAASSTGKYHPDYAQGNGGLLRHTKAAVRIAKDIMDLEMYHFTEFEKSCAILALILHDSCKYGLPGENRSLYTKFEHPVLASQFAKEELPQYISDVVCPLIESHMGQWNTSNRSSYVLAKPVTTLEQVVHLADYLASRKYLEVPFGTDGEVMY